MQCSFREDTASPKTPKQWHKVLIQKFDRAPGNTGWASMNQHGQLWDFLGNIGHFQVFFKIRVSKGLGNYDGQLWRSLGNNGWETLAMVGQLWNSKTFEQKLTKGTKEFGMQCPPRVDRSVLTALAWMRFFFPSFPSLPYVQKSSLQFCCYFTPRNLVSQFDQVRSTSTIARNS